MQDTTTRIISTEVHDRYVPWLAGRPEGSEKDSLSYKVPSSNRLNQIYGTGFARDFNALYTSLFVPSGKSTRDTVPKATKYLDKLNGYFEGYDFENFIPGPGIDDVNIRTNELFGDLDSVLKFMWKDENGNFRYKQENVQGNLEDFTVKSWLENIRSALDAYQGDNEEILEMKALLEYQAAKPDIAPSFDLSQKWQYTDEELKLAETLFDAAKTLFGHFTIRLAFANMLDYYNQEAGIGLMVKRRPPVENANDPKDLLGSIVVHTNFNPHTKVSYDGPEKTFHSYSRNRHLFGYFFLDSSIRLQGVNKEFDLSFPFGPLVGIDSQGSIVKTGPFNPYFSTIERKFTQAMGDVFKIQYESSYRENQAHKFIESQSNLYKFLKKEAMNQILALDLERDQKRFILSKVLRYLRSGCFGYEATGGRNLRAGIKEFLKNKDAVFKIEITDFILRINKEDLLKVEFEYFGDISEFYLNTEEDRDDADLTTLFTSLKRALLSQEALDMAEYFREKIEGLVPKVVKIFPVRDVGDKGYQFVRKNPSNYDDRYWPNRFGDLPGFFEIDLTNPGSDAYRRSIYQLKHMVWIMQAHDTSFIVTQSSEEDLLSGFKHDSGVEYSLCIDDYICIFNREGFTDSLYSVRTTTGRDKSNRDWNYQIILGTDPGLYSGELPWNWEISCSASSGSSDFSWYLNKFATSLDQDDYNYFRALLGI